MRGPKEQRSSPDRSMRDEESEEEEKESVTSDEQSDTDLELRGIADYGWKNERNRVRVCDFNSATALSFAV